MEEDLYVMFDEAYLHSEAASFRPSFRSQKKLLRVVSTSHVIWMLVNKQPHQTSRTGLRELENT